MEEFKSEHSYFCWICGNSVELESCKTDDHGMVVHGHCYLQKVALAAELMPLAVRKPLHRIGYAMSPMATQPRTRIHPVRRSHRTTGLGVRGSNSSPRLPVV